ncbi:MAG: hypothetical protein M4579_002051 [Chaenotheca gracillima]|nr:MAG: hypothetical protein M4579_002051 [Chaenotheca gracillima]
MTNDEENDNYELFREALSGPIIEKSRLQDTKPKKQRRGKGRKNSKSLEPATTTAYGDEAPKDEDDAEQLADFVDYLATELFTSLPLDFRTLSYSTFKSNPVLEETYSAPLSHSTISSLCAPIPHSITDTLSSYSLISASTSLPSFLGPILSNYVSAATIPPPPLAPQNKASACEICGRDWIPLTYHHLIPRGVHDKVRKRGWHEEWQLNAVAWLCRACHSFVHGLGSNEVLAREFWSVELLLAREDVRRWASWVGRVRWKAR